MRQSAPFLVVLSLCAALIACAPKPNASAAAASGLDTAKLEAAVDQNLGGADTCVAVADTQSGRLLYQYGDAMVCMRALPPCETFEVANDLIGLDQGVITPATVYRWDKSSQPVAAWQADADMEKAFKDANPWWDQRLAKAIGQGRFASTLPQLGYGDHNLTGAADNFWTGPQAGGNLGISTRQQVDFMHRLFAGQLPVKPQSAQAVIALLSQDARPSTGGGQATMSGKAGSCPSISDGSRGAAWWTGRLVTPKHDLTFAASVEAAAQPSGDDVESRLKDAFADAGLWPAEQ